MKKIINSGLIILSIVFAIAVILYLYLPFARGFIDEKWVMGDSMMHLANILAFKANHPFPVMAWKVEWAGYPVVEGYPWLHYYLIQPLLSLFKSVGYAMDWYSAAFLFLYFFTSFLLLFYTSRNALLAILFTIVIIFGADAHMPFSVNSFMTFTASQFFLPLILLLTIVAREKNNFKILILAAIFLSISFYSHGAMTGMVIVPIIFPFLALNKEGKITKETITKTIRFFILFALFSAVQVYQFISYSSQGYLRGVKPFALDIIPARLLNLLSWMNPILVVLVIVFIPFLIIALKKNYPKIIPYVLSFLAILFIFTLMLFNITSMNLVLLAERVLWAMTLIFLVVFSKAILEFANTNLKRTVIWVISPILAALYLYMILVIKPEHFVPDTLKPMDPYGYKPIDEKAQSVAKYSNKFEEVYTYPALSWNSKFDNYRTDGISWAIYSNWNIWSTTNIRYKGRFPAAKNLPLEWSGLIGGSLYGILGEAGTPDTSKWAINQSLFFFDWYAIRHIEYGENDIETAEYLRSGPLITGSEKSLNIVYNDIDKKFVGPIYAPTNVNTMAVVAPEAQYDNFIRTLSYSEFNSKRIIPIYLGSSLASLKKNELKYFDSIFLYGYKKSVLAPNFWSMMNEYVKSGGKLIIETGQKVSEAESLSLPEVFPVKSTKLSVVDKPWNVQISDDELTKGIDLNEFNPLKTKYLPYSISEAKKESLRDWAKPLLMKDGSVVMAYGELGKGIVAWSGINLPFHAIDNRNKSETVIFANILNMFFPEVKDPIEDFEVSHPKSEKVTIKSSEGKGFLIKENYDSGWVAKLNGKRTKIFKAGLFEKYIPFDSKFKENKVELTYYGSPIYWLMFSIALISLIGTLMYLIFNKNPLSFLSNIFNFKINSMEEDY